MIRDDPILWRAVEVPAEFCATDIRATEIGDGSPVSCGGDIRIGDLRGTGQIDLLVYRSCDDAHDGGGMLWDPVQGDGIRLPGLPPPEASGRMAWYHCIPASVCGDEREELVLYNPWTTKVYIYTQADNGGNVYAGFKPGPRQYNPRLMD